MFLLMTVRKNIPNFITLLNLFCGCVAVVYIAENNFEMPFYLVCLGIFFDFFDGFFARLLKVSSPLGLQLDSLADMVTSGVVPGFFMFKFFSAEIAFGSASLLPYFGFVITLGACFRLANFNIDDRQTDSFIGLPTPANALFFMSIPFWHPDFVAQLPDLNQDIINGFFVTLCLLSIYFMNAEIPLFALKIKSFSISKYKLQLCFMAISIVLLILLKITAVPLIIVYYILISFLNNFLQKQKGGN